MQPARSPTVTRDTPDAELAYQIGQGNRAAFEVLMRRFNQPLYRTARSIVRDDTEAEDVLQNAYLQAWQAIASFRGDARLATWLTRIVVNEAIATSRKRSRGADVLYLHTEIEQMNETNHNAAGSAGGLGGNDGASPTPETDLMRTQLRQRLERGIDALPDVYRVVFVMRAVQEMSGEEVATCLAIPEATVRSRFHRARAMLRDALAREVDAAYGDVYAFDGERCERIVRGTLARLDAPDATSVPAPPLF
jgi:RNA polymerase sigma-70 factor (ECF subfamily)